MDLFINDVKKELPENIMQIIKVEAFSSDKINIFSAENVFSELKGFPFYKFLMIYNNNHPLHQVDNGTHRIIKNKIFPLNPDQPHAAQLNTKVSKYNAILIDKTLIREISQKMYGRKDIYFENKCMQYSLSLMKLLDQFTYEATMEQPGYEFVLQGLNYQIAVGLLREMEHNYSMKDTYKYYSGNKKYIKKIIEYMWDNFQKDFTLDELAAEVNYSSYHFIRIFKEETGKTPFEYLKYIKLKKAKEILLHSNKSISEVCFDSGFKNRTYFSIVFKEKFGLSPSEYRKIIK